MNREDIIWFETTYPSASLSWALSTLLQKFRLAHETTPSDYAELGAKELLNEIEAEG